MRSRLAVFLMGDGWRDLLDGAFWRMPNGAIELLDDLRHSFVRASGWMILLMLHEMQSGRRSVMMVKRQTYDYLDAHGDSYEATERAAAYNMAEL